MRKIGIFKVAIFFLAIAVIGCNEEDDSLQPNATFTPSGGAPQGNGGGQGNGNGQTSNLTVMKRQRATVTYVGATWCPPCGAYGDPAKASMESTHGNDVVILNVQSGDAISLQTAFGPKFGRAFQNSVGSTGIPHGYWSGANFDMVHRGFSTSASSNSSLANSNISSIIANDPDIGIAAAAKMTNDTIDIETLTKFYKASANTYIGVYLLEDGVEETQKISGAADEVTSHENVVRTATYTGNDLGVQSIGTSFSENQEVVGKYKITIPGTVLDKTKLQIAVVVWENDQPNGISNSILVDVK